VADGAKTVFDGATNTISNVSSKITGALSSHWDETGNVSAT
jgi:hypothetical protein